jgi:hypothetical protein
VYLEGVFAGQSLSDGATAAADAAQGASGAAMAARRARANSVPLLGVENPELYRRQVAAYQRARRFGAQALRELRTLRFVSRSLDLGGSRLSPDQLARLELLVRLKMKPPEYAAYRLRREPIASHSALAEAVAAAETFYELADARSRQFVEQMIDEGRRGTKVLVTGGFHTALIAAELRARRRSFAVLAPRVTRSGHEALYARRMDETISALHLR